MSNQYELFIKTFKPSEDLIKPKNATIKQFEKILPKKLIEFWKEYGFGNYADGLIKVINPADYADSLYEWLGGEDESKLPIAMTAFGDIFYYRKLTDTDEDVSFLDIHHRQIDVCIWSLNDFFNSFIVDKDAIEEYLKKKLFERASKEKGSINYDEIYYFIPALAIGGSEDIKHIDKGIATVHQSLLFQMGM